MAQSPSRLGANPAPSAVLASPSDRHACMSNRRGRWAPGKELNRRCGWKGSVRTRRWRRKRFVSADASKSGMEEKLIALLACGALWVFDRIKAVVEMFPPAGSTGHSRDVETKAAPRLRMGGRQSRDDGSLTGKSRSFGHEAAEQDIQEGPRRRVLSVFSVCLTKSHAVGPGGAEDDGWSDRRQDTGSCMRFSRMGETHGEQSETPQLTGRTAPQSRGRRGTTSARWALASVVHRQRKRTCKDCVGDLEAADGPIGGRRERGAASGAGAKRANRARTSE